MPARLAKEGKPANATGVESKAVRLELTLEIQKQLRIEAAKHDMSMAAFVRAWVEEGMT